MQIKDLRVHTLASDDQGAPWPSSLARDLLLVAFGFCERLHLVCNVQDGILMYTVVIVSV